MPQSVSEPWLLVALGLAAVIIGALVVLISVLRSPASLENPWVAPAVGVAIILLAAVLWPLYPLLLMLLLPAALVALVLYLFLGGRPAA